LPHVSVEEHGNGDVRAMFKADLPRTHVTLTCVSSRFIGEPARCYSLL